MSSRVLAIGLLTATLLGTANAAAEARMVEGEDPETKGVVWKPEWRKFQPWEGVVTVASGLGIGAIILFNHERSPNWHGGVLIDDPVRDGLRAESDDGRKRAQMIGNVFYYGGLAFPYLVDVVAVTWIGHGKPEVAGQMALIDTEAFAVTGLLSFVSNAVIRRERPYVRNCSPDQKQVFPDCAAGGQSESFFSGHTGIAATTAGLTCAHHANIPLYGGGIGDVMACAATIGGAVAEGYLRLVADKHYLVDVVTGIAIGFPVGYFFAAHHYRKGDAKSTAKAAAPSFTWNAMPTLSTSSFGLSALGSF